MVAAVVLAAVLVGGGGAAAGSVTVATSGPILVVVIGSEVGRRRRAARARLAAERLPVVVDGLLGHLRAGRSLAQACLLVAEAPGSASASPLAPVAVALRQGRGLAEAVERLVADAEAHPDAGASAGADTDRSIRLLGVTLRILADSGGPAVPALQRLRHTLVGVVHGRQRAAVEASQALASAGLLVVAPWLFAAGVAAIEPEVAAFYLVDPVGAACVLVASLLSSLGWWWMQRLVRVVGGGSS